MPVSRWGTRSSSISMPAPPRLAVSQVEQVSPAAPMSWMPTTRPGTAIISRQASISSFSMKGSPFCTAGRSERALRAELLGGEGRPAEAVAAGRGAHVVDGIAEAGRLAAADLVVAQRAQAERVDERVALVGAVEVDVAGDGRHADAVAVVGDAGDDAAQEALRRRASPARRSAGNW